MDNHPKTAASPRPPQVWACRSALLSGLVDLFSAAAASLSSGQAWSFFLVFTTVVLIWTRHVSHYLHQLFS